MPANSEVGTVSTAQINRKRLGLYANLGRAAINVPLSKHFAKLAKHIRWRSEPRAYWG